MAGQERDATLARQVVEAVRQIAVHYGLWLAETAHQLGPEAAVALESQAGDAFFPLLAKRLERALGLDRHVSDLVAGLGAERLEALLKALSVSWLAADGVWFRKVEDSRGMAEILQNLGFVRRVAFTKQCRLFRDVSQGLALTITVVNVDFSPETFVEIEHPAADREAGLAALPVIRDYAARLGLATECPTCYTELCRSARTGTTSKGASPP